MANTIRIKRRASGNAGAPGSLENAELAFNEIDNTLYYGKGTGGAGGTATTVEAIGGNGAFVSLSTAQTVTGNKTFSGTVTVGTPSSDMHAATKLYVDTAITGVATTFTVAGDGGSNQTITTGADTLTISGGTGLTSAATSDTITLNLDNTTVTAGSYGSASAIPTFTVDAQGRLTAAGTASISTSFTVDADSGDNLTISGGDTFIIVGGTGLTSVASATDTITLNLDNTAVTAGSYGSSSAIPTFTVDAQGRLTAAGTASIEVPTSMSTSIYGDSGFTSFSVSTTGGSFYILGGTGLTAAATSSTLTLNLDNTAVTAGSYGSSTATGTFTVDAQGRLTAASATDIRTATTSATGLASFNSSDFAVNAGEVTIKSAGVGNSQLENSTITLGSSTLTLGSTTTSVAGITELTVDNLNFNGNSITSTDSNGNITLSPNGTGTVDVASSRITGLSEPISDNDAATKYYVDNKITGLDWKSAVNLIAKTNVSLTGSTETLVIDGHSALDSADDGIYRILLTAQSTGSQNGIYTYTDDGTDYELVRATDADVYSELIGASVYVMEGTTYTRTGWVQTNHYITDFSNQNWVQFSGAGAYAAGAGLSVSGTEFAVNVATNGGIEIDTDALQLKTSVAGAGLTYSTGVIAVGGTADKITVDADAITIASTYAGQSSITTLGTIATGTWNGSAIPVAYGGTGSTSASDARTALGLAIGTNVQAYSPNLGAIAGLTSAADALPYFTGSGTAAVTTLSSFIRGLLDDADAATARTTLGVDTYTIDGGTF
jgi:hypothetical protein